MDLAASSPENRDLLTERLSRLREERREIEGRLAELKAASECTVKPDDIVDAMLAGLADARRLFDQGTVEERKRVVRAFVESLTVAGTKRSGEIRLKNLPALEALTGAFSVESLAGAGFEPATFGL